MKNVFLFALTVFVFGVAVPASAQQYYECAVKADTARGGICAQQSVGTHMCQLYDGYSGAGIPEHCSGYCLKRSGIPEECAVVTVRESSNKEAHEGRSGIRQGLQNMGLDFDSEAVQNIAGEVQARLGNIENEINTEDGIDSSEVKHVVGKVMAAIKDILGERMRGNNSTSQDSEPNMWDRAVAWSKKDLTCSEKPKRIQKGEIVSVEGEGRAYIERGINILRAVKNAPLMAGDTVVVQEGMTVKMRFDNTGVITVNQKTKIAVPALTADDKAEQCWFGGVQSSISNGIGRGWHWLQEKLQGESFEIQTPTAVAGVRG
jgi:hypothetical protein